MDRSQQIFVPDKQPQKNDAEEGALKIRF